MDTGVKFLIAGIVLFAVLVSAGIYVATNFISDTANDALDEAAPFVEDASEALDNIQESQELKQRALAECLAKADGRARRIKACNQAFEGSP